MNQDLLHILLIKGHVSNDISGQWLALTVCLIHLQAGVAVLMPQDVVHTFVSNLELFCYIHGKLSAHGQCRIGLGLR